MSEVHMTVDSERVEGKKRTYLVTVDKGHRPAQMPKRTVAKIYADEVTTENVDNFDVMFIRDDLHQRITSLFGGDKPSPQPYDNLTFNECLAQLLDWVGEIQGKDGSLPNGMRDLARFIQDNNERDDQLRLYDESNRTAA